MLCVLGPNCVACIGPNCVVCIGAELCCVHWAELCCVYWGRTVLRALGRTVLLCSVVCCHFCVLLQFLMQACKVKRELPLITLDVSTLVNIRPVVGGYL